MIKDKSALDEDRLSKYYTTQKLGFKQSMTPEGFLLCEGVPIARTGPLVYLPEELGGEVVGGPDGLVYIERGDEDVFKPETLASFEGKPVTNDHPMMGVTPGNFKDLVVGVTQNVRRGLDQDSDLMLADLLIMEQEAITAVRDGKREVSCGYDAKYEQVLPGRGRQYGIIGNHVALVDRGRCGYRCSIQDKELHMTKAVSVMDRIRAAFLTKDEKAFDAALAEVGQSGDGKGINLTINTAPGQPTKDEMSEEEKKKLNDADPVKKDISEMKDSIKKLTDAVAKLADADKDDEDEDKSEKTNDAESVKVTLADLAARAEILSPGFKVPTTDGADPKKFADAVCSCKRAVLEKSYKTEDGEAVIKPFLGGQDIAKVPAHTVDAAFIGASEILKTKNNGGVASTRQTQDFGKPVSASSLNAKNKAFWDGKRKTA